MEMFHYRTAHKVYAGYPAPQSCPFCDVASLENVVRATDYCYIVPNRVFYDVWELRTVVDHLLVIPKRHVHSLAELTDAERIDIMTIVGEFEQKNYNVYARGMASAQRSVAHQHTHLIKTLTQQAHGSLTIKKPYLLLKF